MEVIFGSIQIIINILRYRPFSNTLGYLNKNITSRKIFSKLLEPARDRLVIKQKKTNNYYKQY